MSLSSQQIFLAAVSVAVGLFLFLKLVNRHLILLRDSRMKGPIIEVGGILVLLAGIYAGISLPFLPSLCVLVFILIILLFLELNRLHIRRACHGSYPVGPRPHTVPLHRPVTTTDFQIYRYRVTLPEWRGKPLRIVHLTDLHIHRKIPEAYYERVINEAQAAEPDLAFFTGDFTSTFDQVDALERILRPVSKHGDYAVLGNHDYWDHPEIIEKVIKRRGITLLTNESVRVNLNDQEVLLTGYDYPWGTKEKSIDSSPDGVPHFVLTHTPDNIYRLAESGADCVFAGHYHAGQLRLPFIGPIVVPSVYGRRFDHGHFLVDGTHLFIPSGIGVTNPAFRLYCQPDFFIVDVCGTSEMSSA